MSTPDAAGDAPAPAPTPSRPIQGYLAALASIDGRGPDAIKRVEELHDRYFAGIIDRDYSHDVRLDPRKIDSRAKLWFFIDRSLRLDMIRTEIVSEAIKQRELPGRPEPQILRQMADHEQQVANQHERAARLGASGEMRPDTAHSTRDLATAANATLAEVRRHLVILGFGAIVPPAPWPTLSHTEAVAELIRVGKLLVELEARSAGPQPACPPPPASPPNNLAEIADALAKEKPSSHIPQRMLKYMDARESAPFHEIAEHVHDNTETSPSAIKQAVLRTNGVLERYASPVRLSVSDQRVLKTVDSA